MEHTEFRIEQVKERLAELALKDSTPRKYAGLMLEAYEIIKQREKELVKAQNQSPPDMSWISVKDKLPERFVPAIVCREKGRNEFVVEAGQRDTGDWWRIYGTRTKRVTHWMPLPDPPKEV